MKQKLFIFYILLVLVFYSCNDKNDPSVNYLDNKLIEGTWVSVLTSEDGSYTIDSAIYIFENNKAEHIFYAHVLGLDALKFEGKDDLGIYSITDSCMFFSIRNDRNCYYKFGESDKDSLYIRNPMSNPPYWHGFKKLRK